MAEKIRLIHACFPQTNSAACSEDNAERKPQHFEWCRESCDSLYTWFTNWTLRTPDIGKYPARVAWLLEPPSIQDWPYKWTLRNREKFDAIMTYDKRLLELGDNRFKFCPHGGSRIDWDLWGIYPKTKDVCMIVSDKKESEGQKLRHMIAQEFGDRIDVYGPSYTPFKRKFEVLKDYRYCVVVESIKMDYYFSEKFIDAVSVGCMPIYWGCPSIEQKFGFVSIQFDNLASLAGILLALFPFVKAHPECWTEEFGLANFIEKAKQYRMPEDWMFAEYSELLR